MNYWILNMVLRDASASRNIALHWQQQSYGGVCEQKYSMNISKILQKYCVTLTTVVTWRSMRATQRMKTMRLQCQQHMTTHNQFFIIGLCLFLCSCLTISFMRRFKKSKLDVFVDSTEAGFVEKILMEVSIWKCLNYLILKTTYLSGLHFWASCPQNQMAW